jgi:hypothetical protein
VLGAERWRPRGPIVGFSRGPGVRRRLSLSRFANLRVLGPGRFSQPRPHRINGQLRDATKYGFAEAPPKKSKHGRDAVHFAVTPGLGLDFSCGLVATCIARFMCCPCAVPLRNRLVRGGPKRHSREGDLNILAGLADNPSNSLGFFQASREFKSLSRSSKRIGKARLFRCSGDVPTQGVGPRKCANCRNNAHSPLPR